MKKIILFSALVLLIFAIIGCDKEENILKEDAVIIYEGDPALDGCGYFIKVRNAKYKPISLLPKFRIENLKVKITYQILTDKWSCNWQEKKYMQIKIINISKK